MSDFDDDETLERELFAHRRRALDAGGAGEARATQASTRAGVDDVFARVAVARRRSQRTRLFGFARVVSQAGTAFAAAAACMALVRGLPASTTDEVRRDDVRVFTHASSGGASASHAPAELASHGAGGLACHAEGDAPGDEAACEAPAIEVSSVAPVPPVAPKAETFATPIVASPSSPLACESISCGGEVTCGGDGP